MRVFSIVCENLAVLEEPQVNKKAGKCCTTSQVLHAIPLDEPRGGCSAVQVGSCLKTTMKKLKMSAGCLRTLSAA